MALGISLCFSHKKQDLTHFLRSLHLKLIKNECLIPSGMASSSSIARMLNLTQVFAFCLDLACKDSGNAWDVGRLLCCEFYFIDDGHDDNGLQGKFLVISVRFLVIRHPVNECLSQG